jgi:trans-aconitate methyltransferase
MGTGTGIWAIDFADEFPSAAVTGNDLSPIQPSWLPSNLRFIVDDLESPRLYKRSEPFDFIHGRAIAGSIKDWPRRYKQIYEHLKPGGWIELQEYEGFLNNCPLADACG